MEDKNINELLNKAYKNVRMASFAIDCIITKIKDKKLEDLLRKQNKFYLESVKKIEHLAKSLNLKLKDINPFLKAMSFISIKMKTLLNNDSPKIADMLIQGTTMGITNTIKANTEYKSYNEEVNEIIKKIISHEEEFVDSLKTFL